MLIITVHVDRPPGQAIGIKEQIAMDLERFGDTRVVSVEVVDPEQVPEQKPEPIGWDDVANLYVDMGLLAGIALFVPPEQRRALKDVELDLIDLAHKLKEAICCEDPRAKDPVGILRSDSE